MSGHGKGFGAAQVRCGTEQGTGATRVAWRLGAGARVEGTQGTGARVQALVSALGPTHVGGAQVGWSAAWLRLRLGSARLPCTENRREEEGKARLGFAQVARLPDLVLRARIKGTAEAFLVFLAREKFSGENSRADNVFKGICSILLIAKLYIMNTSGSFI